MTARAVGQPRLRAVNPARSTVLGSLLPATSFRARFMGLMGRRELAVGDGLWLTGTNGIHMLFMHFAIDAVFLGRPAADGSRPVVAIRSGLRPWTGVVWWVRGGHGVLELPAGTAAATSTVVGDSILLEPVEG